MACHCIGKTIIFFTSLLTIAIGIAILVVGIIHVSSENPRKMFTEKIKSAQQGIFIAIIVIGFFFALNGLMGLISLRKGKQCAKLMYNCGNYIFLIIFIAMAVIGIVVSLTIAKDLRDSDKCASSKWIKSANEYYLKGREYFCSSDCTCYVDSSTAFNLPTPTLDSQSSDSDGAVNVQSCPDFSTDVGGKSDYIDLAKFVEEQFNCAGICTASDIYTFSNINRGSPTETSSCGKVVGDKLNKYGKIYFALCIVIAFIILVNICTIRTLYKEQKQDPKKENDKKAKNTKNQYKQQAYID